MARLTTPMLLLCGFGLVATVTGANGQDKDLRIVVDLAPRAVGVDRELQEQLDSLGTDVVNDIVGLSDAVDTGFGTWGVSPPARLVACTEEPRSLAELEQELANIEELIQSLEYGRAQNRLSILETQLCACTEPVTSKILSRIPFLHGVVSYYADNPEGAVESFSRAGERDPDLEWDIIFPPDPQQLFLQGLASALKSTELDLKISPDERPEEIVVNGASAGPAVERVDLKGERHLLQFRDAGGSMRGVWLVTGHSGESQLLGLDQIYRGLADSTGLEAARPYLDVLSQAAARRGDEEVLVVRAGPNKKRSYWYRASDSVWVETTPVQGREVSQVGRNESIAGAILVGIGGGVVAVGTAVSLGARSRALEVQETIGDSAGLYDLHIDEFMGYKTRSDAGVVILVGGSVAAAAGIVLLASGASKHRKATVKATALWIPGPDGGTFALQGRF